METLDISQSQEIYTVSQLNREVKLLLEGSFPLMWVEGEISNFVAPNSGHWYFSLKDANSQVRCAMFKLQNSRLGFIPKNGMHVILKARISLYEGRGDFQLLAEHIEEAGLGKLRQEFEILKKKLADAGLFNEEHKKKIPTFPSTIGVITSATGAAIRDILTILKRRHPSALVIIYPTLVQGETAAASIANAIQTANRRKECDVLILARGGGSLEDLWSFNEERVAYAIYNSDIPLVSGVGHEIDFTIADFVADLRAPTPSAAAELITPNRDDLLATLQYDEKQLSRVMHQQLQRLHQHLSWAKKHLYQQHPKRRLTEQAQKLDYCELNLTRLQHKLLHSLQARLHTLSARFTARLPQQHMQNLSHRLHSHEQQLTAIMQKTLQSNQQLLLNLIATLDGLSPLATLTRGFAIATRDKDHRILVDVGQIKPGEKIHVQLRRGKLGCTVDETTS